MSLDDLQLYDEGELLQLSALSHLIFCQRRASLLLLENVWHDNIFTMEGNILHRKTDEKPAVEMRGDVRIVRSLALHSMQLGLTGKADVVEFHRVRDGPGGVALPGVRGRWRPFPVEFKRGKLRREVSFEVQLCGQALCLEEMLQCRCENGAIFFGKTKRRLDVSFDGLLRQRTRDAANELHQLFRKRKSITAEYSKKCDKCSLVELCLPKLMDRKKSVRRYLNQALLDADLEVNGND